MGGHDMASVARNWPVISTTLRRRGSAPKVPPPFFEEVGLPLVICTVVAERFSNCLPENCVDRFVS